MYPFINITAANLDISVDHFTDPFYFKTWFWVCFALFLIFLLIILIRGKKKKTVFKVEEETNKESNQPHLTEQSRELDLSS